MVGTSCDGVFGQPPIPSSLEPYTQAIQRWWNTTDGEPNPKSQHFAKLRGRSSRINQAMKYYDLGDGAQSESACSMLGPTSARIVHQFQGAAGVKTQRKEPPPMRRQFPANLSKLSDINEAIFNQESPMTARSLSSVLSDPAEIHYDGAAGKKTKENPMTPRTRRGIWNMSLRSSVDEIVFGRDIDTSQCVAGHAVRPFRGAAGKQSVQQTRKGNDSHVNRAEYSAPRASSAPTIKPRWR